MPQIRTINRKTKAGKGEGRNDISSALSPAICAMITFPSIMKSHLPRERAPFSPHLLCSYLPSSGTSSRTRVTKGTLPLQLTCLSPPVLNVAVAGCSFAPLQVLPLELSVLFSHFKLNALLGTSKGVSGETLWYFFPSLPPSFKVTDRGSSLFHKG